MAKHRTARQWASVLESYERSGLTQAAFCQRRGLALSTLQYRLRRHRASAPQYSEHAPEPEPPSSPRLLELIVPAGANHDLDDEAAPLRDKGAPEGGLDVRIELPVQPGGLAIHCRPGVLAEVLRQISTLPVSTLNPHAS